MKKTTRFIVIILVIAALAGGGYGGWRLYGQRQAQRIWLDERKIQTQAVQAKEEGQTVGRTVLSAAQQKSVVKTMKTMPDPFTGTVTVESPVEQVESALIFHFGNRDVVCYTASTAENSATGYSLIAYDGTYHSVAVSKDEFDLLNGQITAALQSKAKNSVGLRHWIDWKPTYVTCTFPETGTRVITQEEVYSITRLLRLRGIASQDAVQNYVLRSSMLVNDYRYNIPFFMDEQAGALEGEPTPNSVITFYYPNGYIKLVYFNEMRDTVFIYSDSQTGVYNLDGESADIYAGTMNQILVESQLRNEKAAANAAQKT